MRESFGRALGAGLVMAGVGLGACTGDIGENPAPGPKTQSETCSPTADPIRRLTVDEYRNTVAELLPGVPLPAQLPVPDERTGGFVGQAAGQSVSALGVQRYEELATTIGESAAASMGTWAPCLGESVDCVKQIARELGYRGYRRPLTAEETAALEAFATSVHADFGPDAAVALVVQAILESPSFLYRPEVGLAPADGIAALDDFEMASRLSYFFLDSMPDAQLFAAAEAGLLTTDEGVEAEARRLLQDPRARPVITGFFAEWLRLYKIEELALDAAAFPEYDEQLRLDLARSVELYLDKAVWEDDAWASLMTGSYGYVNDRLAPLFGVPAPGTTELVYTDLDPAQRKGVLTQPALLAATSHGIAHSPIYRGVTMLDAILCDAKPAPPPGILDDLEEVPVAPGEVCTIRDGIEKTHTVRAECQGCHQSIDGAGFTFESYDALGRFRTEENGCAVDSRGNFPGTLGEVSGAIEMAEKLAESDVPMQCVATHLFRYASGRQELTGDGCEIDALTEAMKSSSGSLQETIIQMALSPAFRSRPTP